MESDLSFMDFNFFDVAQKGCFSVLNIALNNLDLYHFDVNCQNKDGNTLLHYIAAKGNSETTNKLLHLGAYPNILNSKGETPLHLACLAGHLNICKVLLEYKANLNALDYKGESPVFKSVKSGNTALSKWLITKGANIKQVNRNEENLLHLAAKFGDKGLTQILLHSGLSPSAVTKYGDDPVWLAIKSFSEETIKLLLEQRNFDVHRVDENKCTLLHLSVKLNNKKACEQLIRLKLDVNSQDITGSTPLHLAAELCHLDIIKLLLKHNADINKKDYDGYTALHNAAGVPARQSNSQEVVHTLLMHGADAEALTCHGDLALHRAAAYSNASAVVLLYKRKLVNCKNYYGLTAIDMAEINGRKTVVMLLKTLKDNVFFCNGYSDDDCEYDKLNESAISDIICYSQNINNNNVNGDKNRESSSKTLIPILKRRSDVTTSFKHTTKT